MRVVVNELVYLATLPIDETTMLGIKRTREIPCDSVRVTVDVYDDAGVKLIAGAWHWFRPEAIGDRIAGYGHADTDHAAGVASLIREAAFSWGALEPAGADRVDELGGVDSRISVEFHPAVAAGVLTIADAHGDRIQAAIAAATPAPATELQPAGDELPPPAPEELQEPLAGAGDALPAPDGTLPA